MTSNPEALPQTHNEVICSSQHPSWMYLFCINFAALWSTKSAYFTVAGVKQITNSEVQKLKGNHGDGPSRLKLRAARNTHSGLQPLLQLTLAIFIVQ